MTYTVRVYQMVNAPGAKAPRGCERSVESMRATRVLLSTIRVEADAPDTAALYADARFPRADEIEVSQ